MARKKYTLVKIAIPEDKTGWKYNTDMKMWNMVRDGKGHVAFSIDTKCLAENYIQYNFNRIGTRVFPK